MLIEETGETRVRTSIFPYAYKLKNIFQLAEKGIGNTFLWNFRTPYSSRLHKIS